MGAHALATTFNMATDPLCTLRQDVSSGCDIMRPYCAVCDRWADESRLRSATHVERLDQLAAPPVWATAPQQLLRADKLPWVREQASLSYKP